MLSREVITQWGLQEHDVIRMPAVMEDLFSNPMKALDYEVSCYPPDAIYNDEVLAETAKIVLNKIRHDKRYPSQQMGTVVVGTYFLLRSIRRFVTLRRNALAQKDETLILNVNTGLTDMVALLNDLVQNYDKESDSLLQLMFGYDLLGVLISMEWTEDRFRNQMLELLNRTKWDSRYFPKIRELIGVYPFGRNGCEL